jgi:addiction module RelE/StbE family toxin
MVKRKIVWTQEAYEERKQILTYWLERNQSKTYPVKLNKLIKETLQLASNYPESGRKTNFENGRVLMIRDYLLFYEVNKTTIVVLSIWDERRNDKTPYMK